MSQEPTRGARRSWKFHAALALIATAALVLGLSQLGRALTVEDPVTRSDAIVVLAGARTDRWVEAIELYREGHAERIVLSPGETEGGESYLRARGVRLPSYTENVTSVMAQLGVPREAVLVLAGEPANTAQEASAFRRLAEREGWRRVTVVTSKLHTRRARFAFRRELAGTGIDVFVRGSRFDRTDPARWWRRRQDVREALVEAVKLITYLGGLGG
jgi:uncharacterized SAM-binding protein YcdF (DUF218 family)